MSNQMPKINLIYSVEDEKDRVIYTLNKLKWYREKGYSVGLPEGVNENTELGDIRSVVKNEYNEEKYKEMAESIAEEISKNLKNIPESFEQQGLKLEDEYNVILTLYGVGGSYSPPNNIVVNFRKKDKDSLIKTILHEVIHISIEEWIQKYGVSHWEKEKLVDLLFINIFPDLDYKEQNLPEDLSHVEKTFRLYKPDIKKVCQRLGG